MPGDGGFAATPGGIGFTALAGTGSDFITQGFGYGLNSLAASKAHDRTKNLMTRGPLYETIGLRAAGLNPILAATGGWKGASHAGQMAAPAQTHGKGIANLLAAKQGQLLDAQTNAAAAAAMKQTHEGQLAEVKTILDQLRIPEAQWHALWNMTDAGRENLRQGRIHAVNPDDPLAMILKDLKAMWQDRDPSTSRVNLNAPAEAVGNIAGKIRDSLMRAAPGSKDTSGSRPGPTRGRTRKRNR